ncbi:PadR family transcriptional regulator [Actinoplanes regularis]|uniref:PadR family transcriptional regulator, regulatory protein PadR n=1 Tax=Actinoplanes regularis TaxID=52697 RepID=A0A238ZUV9_9ACTN|nr:PadR family transcriptional regulator [Actinoplanes regularis]GIE90239.1 PadR family transcriptional regulator [Actinoplanes regularis]SNR87130.1 PadR family transcriptional regulator, regulatory protein PadR [Actinoplanes regularis]
MMPKPWLHGFLDLCLLAMLRERADYGYGLAQRLATAGVADVPGGTLYPALLRLEEQGLAVPRWAPSESGPRRKYYEITPAGLAALAAQARQWATFRDGVDTLLTAQVSAPVTVSGSAPASPKETR